MSKQRDMRGAGALVVLMCLLSATLWRSPGTGDVEVWQQWYANLQQYGLLAGYAKNEADYPPLSSVVLCAVGHMANWLSLDSHSAIKLSIAAFHVLASALFWWSTKDLALTVLLHVGLLLNSVLLGYLDIYFAPFLLLALRAMQLEKPAWFTVFYCTACLVKWQPLIVGPFFAMHYLRIRSLNQYRQLEYKKLIVQMLVPALVIVLVTAGVFQPAMLRAFRQAFSHGVLSANALNFNWLVTYFSHVFFPAKVGPLVDGLPELIITSSPRIVTLPKLLFLGSYLYVLGTFFRREKTFENTLFYALGGYWAYYTFNIGVHENHLFPACILAMVLIFVNRKHFLTGAFVLMSFNLNLFFFYGGDGAGPGFSRVVFGLDATVLFAATNVVFFIVTWLRSGGAPATTGQQGTAMPGVTGG